MTSPARSPAQPLPTDANRARGTAARILLLLTGSLWFVVAAFVDQPGQLAWLALYGVLMVLVWRLWRRAHRVEVGPMRLSDRHVFGLLAVFGLLTPALGWADWAGIWTAVPVTLALAGGLYLSWLPTREYDAGLKGEV